MAFDRTPRYHKCPFELYGQPRHAWRAKAECSKPLLVKRSDMEMRVSDVAYLFGGKSDGETVEPAVFEVKVTYPDGTWDTYEHVALGDGYPIILRASSDQIGFDEIVAMVKQRGLGPTA